MPIIKSAKKRMRQNEKRRKRNYITRSLVKTHFKKALTLIKDQDKEGAKKAVDMAYSVLDTAVKKNILHKNTVARRKSRLARGINDLMAGKVEAKPAAKKGAKKATKKAAEKKTAPKKAAPKKKAEEAKEEKK